MNQPDAAATFKEIENPSAVWLYWHICYWWRMKGGVDYRQRHLVYGNYIGWERKTGMSYRQVHRSLVYLREKGWVETCQMPQGSGNVLLVRPTKFPGGLAANGQGGCPNTANPVGLKEPTYITEIPTEIPDIEPFPQHPPGASEITPETGTEPDTLSTPPVDFPTPQSPPPQNEVEMPHSVHDVQGLVAAQKKVHKPDSTAALGQAWQIGMKEHVPNAMIVVYKKDYAQLKMFAQHCEPGTAEAILHFTLSEWIAFTKFCEQEAGAFKTPATPTLHFLVKFAQQAVTFYLQAQKKPAMATPSLSSNPNPVTAQLIAGQEPAPKTVSLDEVLAPYDPDADYED